MSGTLQRFASIQAELDQVKDLCPRCSCPLQEVFETMPGSYHQQAWFHCKYCEIYIPLKHTYTFNFSKG